MNTKSLGGVQIKDATKGEIEATFATFNVIDSDGDVTLPGAFDDGAPVRISAYGHQSWMGALPVGKGRIKVTSDGANLVGQFFMDTTHGRDTFLTVKAMSEDDGALQEWSYGYDPVKFSFGEHDGQRVRFLEKQNVPEVSPVLVGAGVGTRTVAAKAAGMTFSAHAGSVLAEVEALAERAAEVVAKRQEKGKGLGSASAGLLEQVQAQLKALERLLTDPEPDQEADQAQKAAQAAYLSLIKSRLEAAA